MTKQILCVTVLLIATKINVHGFTTVSSAIAVPSTSFRQLKQAQNRDPISVRLGTALETFDVEVDKVHEKNEKFDWFKAWYPIVNVEILDPEKPHRFQLLGENIVVWNDSPIKVKDEERSLGASTSTSTSTGLFQSKKKRPRGAKRDTTNGSWRAFVDECPHRKVPLSEGRVEDDGTLLCSYHGWRFDGDGNCVAVPQINSPNELLRIKNDPKTNCNAYPTQVINGVLFVWPSSDKDATLESALTPVVHRPDPVNKDNTWIGPWNYRELPYGADFFIENVVDSAHVSISHHNVVGSRYSDQSMVMSSVGPITKSGFSISGKTPFGEHPAITTYYAPSLVAIDALFGSDGASQTLELYTSPSRPGFCNHVGRMVISKDKTGKMPKLLSTFTIPMPKWLNHVLAASFLNQDGLFLHHQERSMAETGKYKSVLNDDKKEQPYHYTKAVYPVNTDLGVIKFRNWMRQLAGGRIPYRHNPSMPPASNDIVFDQWNGHTKYCKICQDALGNLKKIRAAAFFMAACMAVVRPEKLGIVGNLVTTMFLGGMGLAINKLIGMFYRYEVSHAHND